MQRSLIKTLLCGAIWVLLMHPFVSARARQDKVFCAGAEKRDVRREKMLITCVQSEVHADGLFNLQGGRGGMDNLPRNREKHVCENARENKGYTLYVKMRRGCITLVGCLKKRGKLEIERNFGMHIARLVQFLSLLAQKPFEASGVNCPFSYLVLLFFKYLQLSANGSEILFRETPN